MADILTVTLNPTIDVSSEADVVQPTRKTRTINTRHSPGGGGINVARVIAALGGDVEAVYLAGGEIGSLLDRLLVEEQIPHQSIRTESQTRIGYTVREMSTGLEYRFVPTGPPVDSHELQNCFEAIQSHKGSYIIASGSLPQAAPPDTYARIADMAAAKGVRFVLDSSGVGLRTALNKSKAFLVKPSFGELEQLVGRKLNEKEAGDAAAEIVARGAAEFVVVTMGPDGALFASRTGVIRFPAIHVRVRSAVGAGDSFLGAMIWALSDRRTPEEAVKLGLAAGAAAAMTPGTQLCRRADIFELFQKIKES